MIDKKLGNGNGNGTGTGTRNWNCKANYQSSLSYLHPLSLSLFPSVCVCVAMPVPLIQMQIKSTATRNQQSRRLITSSNSPNPQPAGNCLRPRLCQVLKPNPKPNSNPNPSRCDIADSCVKSDSIAIPTFWCKKSFVSDFPFYLFCFFFFDFRTWMRSQDSTVAYRHRQRDSLAMWPQKKVGHWRP